MKTATTVRALRRGRLLAPLAFLALVALGGVGKVLADQTATPVTPAPIAIETLGSGKPSDTPGKAILLLRVTLQPGAAFPAHVHPGALVIAVASGDFAFTVLHGEADATTGVATGTPGPTQTLTAGREVVFHAGDEIFEQQGVIHTARNAGDTPAVVLVAALVDPTKPFLQPVSMDTKPGMATPGT
jgi:quercetin dioxygenase-like cupin family protein